MNRIVIASVAFAAALSSAHAAEKVAVRYGDLNLSSSADARTLLTRFEKAAEHVCGGRPLVGDLHGQAIHDACVKDAMNTAVASVHSPVVASLYNNETIAYRVANR